MPMSDEERRRKERERKARQRAANRAKPKLEALPAIGPTADSDGGTQGGTPGGTGDGTPDDLTASNYAAAKALVGSLDVPSTAQWRVPLVLRLARDLDAPSAIPQRSGLAAKYEASLEALIAAAKPREADPLDEMRRRFYSGRTDAVDDDPEARKRSARRKA